MRACSLTSYVPMRVRISVVLMLLLIGLGCDAAEDLNQPPSVGFEYTPEMPSVGTPVEFSAQASDPDLDGQVESYFWTFGDGSEGTGADPTHTYEEAGSYDVTVTVTDDGGRTDSQTQTVEVQP